MPILPKRFISFFLPIVFFINLCDGRSSMELIGIIGSQVLQNSNNNPQTPPPTSLPPFESTPPLTLPPFQSPSQQPISQPSDDTPPSFCPLLPPPSPALLPLPPPQQQRIHPPPSPQLPEPGAPTAAPAPPIHVPATPGKSEPPPLPTLPPSPPHKGTAPTYAVWCVAKPTVPEGVMQAGIDYACGSGADCKPIQVNGSCYQPDTLLAHASFAFNSYFQNKKGSGGTCDFGGTAMLVTLDPSFSGCHFIFI